MKPKSAVNRILKTLDKLYPHDGKCFLNYSTPWQLLFATILSAQCTDDRVNMVTAELFIKFPSLEAYANAETADIEEAIHSTGFYRAKANHLKQSAIRLLNEYNGEVPQTIESLTSLSGVGRKTANVVRGHIFKIPSIVVDTHVMRVSKKLGLTTNINPEKIENDLMEILPKKYWIQFNQQVITHGRKICNARKPKCSECQLKKECENPKE